MKTIHYLHHTHWDREWYRSQGAFRVRLVSTMDLLLKTLDEQEKLKYFILDGQCKIIEDYLQVKPNQFNLIKKLVQENKLIIGPWFIQPDMFLVASESLLRNLQIGINYAKSNFGNVMEIGWIPDAFGQISQTPQIFDQFGFNSIFSWRGFAKTDTKYNYFMWEAPNKKKLINIHFYLGYGFFRYLDSNEYVAKEQLLTNIEKFVDRTFSDNIMFTGGSDHASVQTNLADILEKVNPLLASSDYEIKQSTPQILIDEIKQYVEENNFDIETFKGEAKSPKMGRIHAGIASTRQDLKRLNKVYENLLVDVVEPLNVIMKTLKMPSNIQLCIHAWKYLLENQFHDSIYSSSPEDVNINVANRYDEIKQVTFELIFEALRYTRDRCDVLNNRYPIVLFNTLAFNRSSYTYLKIPRKFADFTIYDENNNEVYYEIVNDYKFDFMSKDFLGILDLNSFEDAKNNHANSMYYDVVKIYVEDMEASGYKVYSYENKKPSVNKTTNLVVNDNIVENKLIKVEFNNNGTINVTNKLNNVKNENLLTLINKGDCGDEYNYSWPVNDTIFNSTDVSCVEITKLTQSSTDVKFKISYNWDVPASTSIESRSNKLVTNNVQIFVSINAFDATIDVDFKVKNNSCDQITLVRMPRITNQTTHVSGDDFYFITRDNQIEDASKWKEQGLTEMPLAMYSFKNILHFDQKQDQSLNIFTDSLTEYEIVDNKHLDLTLFRSVSHLGKANLVTRPGRASGYNLPTPTSQMLDELEFNLKINFNQNNHNQIFNEYKNSYTQLLSVAHRLTNTDPEEWFWENRYFEDIECKLKSSAKNIEIDATQVALSAVVEDIDTGHDTLRLFNANDEVVTNIKIKLNDYKCSKVNEVKLNKEIINELEIVNNEVVIVNIQPYSFTTIELIKE